MPKTYRVHFSYAYYGFNHYHSTKDFLADDLEHAQKLAEDYAGEFEVDPPFPREIIELETTTTP
jgi:hypothetical protein